MLRSWIGASENPVIRVETELRQRKQIVLRLAAGAIVVADRDLGDALGERVRERGHERRLLIAIDHRIDDMPAVRAQHASVIVHWHADDERGQPVVQARGVLAVGLVVAFLAPSADDVVAFVDRGNQPRDFFRRILQIGVECDDDIAARLFEAREDRRMLSEVARKLDHPHAALFARRDFAQDAERVVARAVVDENRLPRAVEAVEHRLEARPQRRQIRGFVEHRHHDRDQASLGARDGGGVANR